MRKYFTAVLLAVLLCGCSNEVRPEISETESTAEIISEAAVTTAATEEVATKKAESTAVATTAPTETTTIETTIVTEPTLPEAVLPTEAEKIDFGIDSEQKYSVQMEILDKENILVLYEFKDENYERTSAEAKIFSISDGKEKLHIEIPEGKVDGYLIKDALWCREYRGYDDVYFIIYSYEFNEKQNYNYGISETIVYTDYTYKSREYTNGVSYYPKFTDLGGKHIIRETEYCNFYDQETGKILLNSIFEGYDSKDGLSYSYEFPIDENRFVYSMWGYEWCWGFGIYDFKSGTAKDVPDVFDYRPMGYYDGKIYSYYCEHDGFTDNILYVTDINTLDTTPFHKFETVEYDNTDLTADYDYVYDYIMTPNGKFLMNMEYNPKDSISKVILYSTDTLEAVKEYEFKKAYITFRWYTQFTEDGKAVLTDDKRKCLYILDLNK